MIKLGGYSLTLKSTTSNQTIDVTSGDYLATFEIRKVIIKEAILEDPSFELQFSTTLKTSGVDIDTATMTLSNEEESLNYDLTALKYQRGIVSGLLIKKDLLFGRETEPLQSSLKDSLEQLGVRKKIEYSKGVGDISGEPIPFYRIEETKYEATKRLLDMVSEDTVWSINTDSIKIIPTKISNPKEIMLGEYLQFSYDKTGSDPSNFESLSGSSSSNINYGRYSVPVPRLSSYPRSAISSKIQKRKISRGWTNCYSIKVSNSSLGLNVGDYVRFPLETSHVSDFLVSSRSTVIEGYNTQYIYEFSNFEGWK